VSPVRDQAARIAATATATGATVDIGEVATRHLLYGLPPNPALRGESAAAERAAGRAAVHEATALWDVRRAVDSDREVKPVEQHIHSVPLPYGEELLRCRRAARARKKRATSDGARRWAPRAKKLSRKGR